MRPARQAGAFVIIESGRARGLPRTGRQVAGGVQTRRTVIAVAHRADLAREIGTVEFAGDSAPQRRARARVPTPRDALGRRLCFGLPRSGVPFTVMPHGATTGSGPMSLFEHQQGYTASTPSITNAAAAAICTSETLRPTAVLLRRQTTSVLSPMPPAKSAAATP